MNKFTKVLVTIFILQMVWVSLASAQMVEYTPTSKTLHGVKNMVTIHSSIKYVEEGGKWVRIEDAKTLHDKTYNNKPLFEWVVIEDDPRYEITIKRFNETCIQELKVKSNYGKLADIPIKINSVEKFKVKIKDDEEFELEDVCINIGEKSLLSSNISFGFNSTTLILTGADNQADLRIKETSDYGGIIRFDISSVPAGGNIDAELSIYDYEHYEVPPDTACDDGVQVWRLDSQVWDEASTFGDLNLISNTTMEYVTANHTIWQGNWSSFNVTNQVKVDYDATNTYTSIGFADDDFPIEWGSLGAVGDAELNWGFWDACYGKIESRENSGGTGNDAELTIIYTSALPTSTPSVFIYNVSNTTYWNLSFNFSFKAVDGGNATFELSAYHNGTRVYHNPAYANNTLVSINVTENITVGQVGNFSVGALSGASNTTSVYNHVRDYQFADNLNNTIVDELQDLSYTIEARYNPDLVLSLDALLNYNDSDLFYSNSSSSNATHYTLSYTRFQPLIQTNNSEIDYHYYARSSLHRGTNITGNSSTHNQNLTYAILVKNITTDKAYYLFDDAIHIDFYVENNTRFGILNTNITIDSFGGGTQSSYTMYGTDTRLYERSITATDTGDYALTVNLTGNLSVSFGGQTRTTGLELSFTVYKLIISTNCTAYPTTAINLEIIHETNGTHIPATVEFIIEGNATHNGTLTGNSTYQICIYPAWGKAYMDLDLLYSNTTWTTRAYYLRDALISNNTQNITLYLHHDTDDVSFVVQDKNQLPEEDAIVYIQRLDWGNNRYYTVAMVKSDYGGDGDTHLETGDVWYRFVVVTDSGTSYSFSPSQLFLDPSIGYVVKTLNLGASATLDNTRTFEHLCTYNQTTRFLLCQVTDTTGLHSTLTLDVWKDGILYSSSNTSDVSASLFELLPNVTGSYYYEFWYTDSTDGATYLISAGSFLVNVTTVSSPLLYTMLSIMIIGTLGMVSLERPSYTIPLTIIGIIISAWIGLKNLAIGSFTALSCLGLLILYKVRY